MAIATSFSTALTGLKTHQTAIDVTSNNISNSSNPDYVRERTVITSLNPINSIPGDIGMGAEVSSIYRITDTFLFNRYTSTSATYNNLDTQEKYLQEIATYFPDVTDDGLYKDIEDFFNAWQDLASNPNDDSVKVALASKTQSLTDNIKTLRNKLTDIQKSINEELDTKIDEANNIIKQIASLNKEISAHEANGESKANELRDKRDALEKRLKELLDVKVYKNSTQSIDAQGVQTIGYDEDYQIALGGYPLVDNTSYHELSLKSLVGNSMITVQKQDFSEVDITKDIQGGEIGALLSLRGTEFSDDGSPTNGVIGEMVTSLDALANGIIRSVNSLYSYSAQENVETDSISTPVSIPNDLTNKSLDSLYNTYHLLNSPVTDGNLILYSYDDNGNFENEIKVNISPSDSINDVLDKINANLPTGVTATLVNGQIKFVDSNNKESSKILVKDDGPRLFSALNEIEYLPLNSVNQTDLHLPLKDGSFDIVVYNDDGKAIATRTIKIDMNSKDPKYSTIEGIVAQINTPNIDDNNDNNPNNDVDDYYQAEFLNGKFILHKKTDENTYIGLDNDTSDFGGSFGINKFLDGSSAKDIDLNETLKNDPTLIRASKTPNSGDNSVANNILQLQYEDVNFYKNNQTTTTTIYSFYRDTTSYLANTAEDVSSKKDTAQTLLTNIQNEYYSLSGVNIDEELINLEKYQRGYQANAKVITTINQMLDALFSIKQ